LVLRGRHANLNVKADVAGAGAAASGGHAGRGIHAIGVRGGGLLAFPHNAGHPHEAFRPAFDCLNLLKVPTPHFVTQVASFATAGRHGITGR
jgi:hypothetical protein